MARPKQTLTITYESIAKSLNVSLKSVEQAAYRGDFTLDCPISVSSYIVKKLIEQMLLAKKPIKDNSTNTDKPVIDF